jgi:hypothetical protein
MKRLNKTKTENETHMETKIMPKPKPKTFLFYFLPVNIIFSILIFVQKLRTGLLENTDLT